MIDTGGTIVKAAEALHGRGRRGRDHRRDPRRSSPTPPSTGSRTASAMEVVITNTLPISADQRFDKLTVLSIAPLIARAIREVFEDGSVTSMFDGHA
jgi:ribose-phosphate pyrophosphokinase